MGTDGGGLGVGICREFLSVRKRALKLACAVWDNVQLIAKKAKLAAFWSFDLLGFGGIEAAKVASKVNRGASGGGSI
jgi:hypothetical protein